MSDGGWSLLLKTHQTTESSLREKLSKAEDEIIKLNEIISSLNKTIKSHTHLKEK